MVTVTKGKINNVDPVKGSVSTMSLLAIESFILTALSWTTSRKRIKHLLDIGIGRGFVTRRGRG
jgi:hypothetical protein